MVQPQRAHDALQAMNGLLTQSKGLQVLQIFLMVIPRGLLVEVFFLSCPAPRNQHISIITSREKSDIMATYRQKHSKFVPDAIDKNDPSIFVLGALVIKS